MPTAQFKRTADILLFMIHGRGALPLGALILILIGGFWLAQDMGWINTTISFWPILLIVVGIGMLVNSYWKR